MIFKFRNFIKIIFDTNDLVYNMTMNIIEYMRHFRIGPFAIFDFAISYFGFYLLSPLIIKSFSYFNVTITKANIMWLVLPIGLLTHIIIGKHTALTKRFMNTRRYYILKIIVAYMIYAGLKGVIFK